MTLSAGMDSIPLEALFAAAIVFLVLLGVFAIGFLLRLASGVMKNTKDRQAEVVTLQQDAIDVTRESIALQRETNRLLSELLAKKAGNEAATGDSSAPKG